MDFGIRAVSTAYKLKSKFSSDQNPLSPYLLILSYVVTLVLEYSGNVFKPARMKRSFNSLRTCLLPAVFFIWIQPGCTPAKQAAAISNETTGQALDGDNCIFSANHALPQHGRSRNLTGIYEVVFRKDTILFHLPYFGRAYTAPIGETTSPLDFRTTDFDFKKTKDDKGKWNITVIPKDYREVQSCDFTFFENGSAQLNVQMINRSPISFSGFVQPGKVQNR